MYINDDISRKFYLEIVEYGEGRRKWEYTYTFNYTLFNIQKFNVGEFDLYILSFMSERKIDIKIGKLFCNMMFEIVF